MTFDPDILRQSADSLTEGIVTTLELFAALMVLGTPLALAPAFARGSGMAALRRAAAIYVNTIRSLPLLVILFFTFYGLPAFGIYVPPFAAALLGLSIVTIAFLSEDMRAALQAIPAGQTEAADALGLPPLRILRRVLLPQMLPILCAPYFTRAIVTLKATSIASMVAVNEITAQSMAGVTTTYRSVEFLTFAALAYLALSAVLALLQGAVQHYLAPPRHR